MLLRQAAIVACRLSMFAFALALSAAPSVAADANVLAGDRTIGDPGAPLTVIEYASPTCRHCASYSATIFPELKKTYIDTGKVYYVYRVFPLVELDAQVEAVARCVPADQYFDVMYDALQNQKDWDPAVATIPDVHAAMLELGKRHRLDAAKVDQCIADPAEAGRERSVGEQAAERYHIIGVPAVVVGDRVLDAKVDFLSIIKAAIDEKLAGTAAR